MKIMDKLKRPLLALGLSITTLEVGFYIISQLITKNDEIISKIVFGSTQFNQKTMKNYFLSFFKFI